MFFFIAIFFLNKESNINVNSVETEIIVNADLLTKHFVVNEKKADNLYRNKAIEIKGNIKSVNFKNNKSTIILYGNNKKHTIICDMEIDLEKKQNYFTPNKEVVIKGICKGFLNDVIILNCIVINKETNE